MIDKVANGGCNTEMFPQPESHSFVVRRAKCVRSNKRGKSERI